MKKDEQKAFMKPIDRKSFMVGTTFMWYVVDRTPIGKKLTRKKNLYVTKLIPLSKPIWGMFRSKKEALDYKEVVWRDCKGKAAYPTPKTSEEFVREYL
jgi:hypothetical protein